MKRIEYDLKISRNFSGILEYVKEDYISDEFEHISYSLSFENGEIVMIILTFAKWNDEGELDWTSKFINPSRFKNEFWKKAPKYANFDECSWKRTEITFRPNSRNPHVIYSTSPTNAYCIV